MFVVAACQSPAPPPQVLSSPPLPRPVAITSHVVDAATDAPIAGATVLVFPSQTDLGAITIDSPGAVARGVSGADGVFHLAPALPPSIYGVIVFAAGYAVLASDTALELGSSDPPERDTVGQDLAPQAVSHSSGCRVRTAPVAVSSTTSSV